jgi:hypothetical protein
MFRWLVKYIIACPVDFFARHLKVSLKRLLISTHSFRWSNFLSYFNVRQSWVCWCFLASIYSALWSVIMHVVDGWSIPNGTSTGGVSDVVWCGVVWCGGVCHNSWPFHTIKVYLRAINTTVPYKSRLNLFNIRGILFSSTICSDLQRPVCIQMVCWRSPGIPLIHNTQYDAENTFVTPFVVVRAWGWVVLVRLDQDDHTLDWRL